MSDRIPTQRLMIHLHPVVPSQIAGNVSKVDDRDSLSIRADLIGVIGWDEEKQNSQILLDFQAGIQRLTVTERPEMIFKAIEEAEREEWAGRRRGAAFAERGQVMASRKLDSDGLRKLVEEAADQEEKGEHDTPS